MLFLLSLLLLSYFIFFTPLKHTIVRPFVQSGEYTFTAARLQTTIPYLSYIRNGNAREPRERTRKVPPARKRNDVAAYKPREINMAANLKDLIYGYDKSLLFRPFMLKTMRTINIRARLISRFGKYIFPFQYFERHGLSSSGYV